MLVELLPCSEEYAQGSACLFEVCVCTCVCTHTYTMHTGLHVMSTFSITGDLPLTAHVNRCLSILPFEDLQRGSCGRLSVKNMLDVFLLPLIIFKFILLENESNNYVYSFISDS